MLQTIFYVLAIIFMTLMIIIAIAVLYVLFFIKNKIEDIHKNVSEKLHMLSSQPATIAANVGAAVADSAISRVRKMMSKKK